jgi:hypothetical protein
LPPLRFSVDLGSREELDFDFIDFSERVPPPCAAGGAEMDTDLVERPNRWCGSRDDRMDATLSG